MVTKQRKIAMSNDRNQNEIENAVRRGMEDLAQGWTENAVRRGIEDVVQGWTENAHDRWDEDEDLALVDDDDNYVDDDDLPRHQGGTESGPATILGIPLDKELTPEEPEANGLVFHRGILANRRGRPKAQPGGARMSQGREPKDKVGRGHEVQCENCATDGRILPYWWSSR